MSSGTKFDELMNQSSKFGGQIGGFMFSQELMKELQPFVSHQTESKEETLLWCKRVLPIAKSGIC